MLGALGLLIDGAAGVAKAVSDSKAARCQLEELQRHNRVIEGRGLYLAPYKYGKGLYLGSYKSGQGIISRKKKKRRKNVKNSRRYNNEHTIGSTGKTHACFRGVFMHDALPISDAHRNENGIVNLDDAQARWVPVLTE